MAKVSYYWKWVSLKMSNIPLLAEEGWMRGQ